MLFSRTSPVHIPQPVPFLWIGGINTHPSQVWVIHLKRKRKKKKKKTTFTPLQRAEKIIILTTQKYIAKTYGRKEYFDNLIYKHYTKLSILLKLGILHISQEAWRAETYSPSVSAKTLAVLVSLSSTNWLKPSVLMATIRTDRGGNIPDFPWQNSRNFWLSLDLT